MEISIQPTRQSVLVLTAILIVYAFLLHAGHINDGPAGMHLWTQSDHYALARGFVENDLNLFKPQTLVYHYQYPDVFDAGRQSLVTAVDFPIHNYIPAVIMKLTGSDSPLIFSLYMLLVSIAGLIYLYKLAFLFNRSEVLSVLIVAFVATSPVFTFYQIRFIPSVPTLSTAIIGLYYGFSFRKTGNFRHFVIGMAFLTLAALTRLTFLIPLLAWAGQEFLFFLREKENRLKKLVTVVVCFSAIAGYFLYNRYLRLEYGGMFLNTFMPADSWPQLLDILREIVRNWKYEYVAKAHYIVLLAGLLMVIYRFFGCTEKRTLVPTRWFIVFLLTGSTVFFLLMCVQFMAHDYYALDVFFVPMIVILVVLSERFAPMNLLLQRITTGFAVLIIPAMIWLNVKVQDNRIESERWGLNAMVVRNFEHSEQLLKRLHISNNEKLVILDPLPRNIPFLYMHRTGYVVMRNHPDDLKAALDLPFRYYVFQNELFLSDIYKVYPEIIGQLEPIGTDGRITVCRKRNSGEFTSLFHFLQLDNKKPVFEAKLSDPSVKEWEVRAEPTSEKELFNVKAASDFGPVLKLRQADLFREPRVVLFNGKVNWGTIGDIQCVIAFSEKGQLTVYKAFPMKEFLPREDGWRDFQYLFPLPESAGDDVELSVYLWNTEQLSYSVRDVNAKLF